ncbi:MAG: AAA family ATPase, partial [Acutalibacteraceae bacterium]|nr:AAA family ATPase [Acutalibacteraceae bacterium]
MLKKLTLKNYRCFEDSVFPFRDTSVLVGSNNAGKSTIIEALRIVSVVALKYKNSNYIAPPKEFGERANAKGIKLNLENLKIDFRSVVHKYREDDGINAEIHALFDGDVSIKIILNSQIQFAFIYNKKNMITSRTQTTCMNNLLLYT